LKSKYVLQPAPQTHCGLCGGTVRLLVNRQGFIDRDHPAFYLCCNCGKVSEVGVGPIPTIEEEEAA